jgi:hypothetical protein
MLDPQNEREIDHLQLYLTPDEARRFRNYLDDLLEDPEAPTHFHLVPEDSSRDLSFSIVTPRKLQELEYTSLERAILAGM